MIDTMSTRTTPAAANLGPRTPTAALGSPDGGSEGGRGGATTAIRDADLVGPRSERDLRRFEAYCRWSLHTMIIAAAFVSTGQVWDAAAGRIGQGWAVLFIAVVAVWGAASVVLLDLVCRERGAPRPLVWVWACSSVLATAGTAALLPTEALHGEGIGPSVGLGPLGLAVTVGILTSLLGWRRAALAAAAGIVALGVVYVAGPPHAPMPTMVAMLVLTAWFCLGSIPMVLSTRWVIDVVRRLWRSRQVAADLAVAEERLRFSRDLHDVFGRTLSTVTVKSELAAELARRGDERAVAEMEAVREIAQTALTEVRGLVRGYRRIDLVGELAGARGVLRAAGLTPVVTGAPEDVTARLSPEAAEALAWVVREGVTNVLRHGHGGSVRIALHADEGACGVVVENEVRAHSGGPGGDGDGAGSGLVGLRERVEAVGGRLTVDRRAGTFRLDARVPTGDPTPPTPPTAQG